MSPYTHLTLKDRECILLGVTLQDTYQVIAANRLFQSHCVTRN